MESVSKPVAIDSRQVALEMLGLVLRAFGAGIVISVAAALVIVGLVTLAS